MNTSGDDDADSRRKRRRVGQACNPCRHGKLKCDGTRPSCQKCLEANKTCSYGTMVKKRGLRTGYVRALECLWGLVFTSIKGSENTVQKLLLSKPGWAAWIRDDAQDAHAGEESPIAAWRSSLVPQILDSLLSSDKEKDENGIELLTATEEPSLEGLTWASNTMLLSSQPPAQSDAARSPRRSQNGEEPDEGILEQSNGAEASRVHDEQRLANLIDCVGPNGPTRPELPRNAQLLLNRFFSLTHPWMPIVDRHTVYRTFFEYRRQSSKLEPSKDWKTGENALLWAIFAYSTSSHPFSPDMSEETRQPPSTIVNDLYRTARNMIPVEDEGKYATSHVQAFLVLALFQYSFRQWAVADLVTGQAMLVARHIGLNQQFLTTEEQQRTWLACFAVDTLISLHTEQKPHLQSSHVRDLLPLDTTSNEEWEPWHLQQALLPGVSPEAAEFDEPTHTVSVFSLQLEILCIINDWICSNADGHSSEPQRRALLLWEKRLPDHIRIYEPTNDSKSAAPPNVLHLQMMQASLRTRLSPAQSTNWSSETRHSWVVVIEAIERFLECFHEAILPPSCNLVRTISREAPYCNTASLSVIIQQLKPENPESLLSRKQGPEDLGHAEKLNEFLTLSTLEKNEPAALASYPLDPRIQQNFDSFMGPPESWPQPTVANLMLDPIELGDLQSIAAMFSNPTDSTSGDIPTSRGDLSEDGPLGYSSAPDEVDADRDQFRRNLGFTL